MAEANKGEEKDSEVADGTRTYRDVAALQPPNESKESDGWKIVERSRSNNKRGERLATVTLFVLRPSNFISSTC